MGMADYAFIRVYGLVYLNTQEPNSFYFDGMGEGDGTIYLHYSDQSN